MLPSLHALDSRVLSTEATKRGRKVNKLKLPTEAAILRVERDLLSAAERQLLEHAYDVMPQSEGVNEGDWEAAGYTLESSFPVFVKLRETLDDVEERYNAMLKKHELYDKLHDYGYKFVLPAREDLEFDIDDIEEKVEELIEEMLEEWWQSDKRDTEFDVLKKMWDENMKERVVQFFEPEDGDL